MAQDNLFKSAEEWRKLLSEEDFYICRQHGTERAFSGCYWDEKGSGTYHCKCCNTPLFGSSSKYDSGSGWPSFYEALDADKIREIRDTSHGMIRVEILCAQCDCHLGHVFPDGPQPTGLRYCVNSASLQLHRND